MEVLMRWVPDPGCCDYSSVWLLGGAGSFFLDMIKGIRKHMGFLN